MEALATRRILVICQGCGHRNHWKKKPLEIIKCWLTNEFPACTKCGQKVDALEITFPFRQNSVYLSKARKQLLAEGKTEIQGLVFS
jgi:DNA-directed RNA polymerase subunit RPC12/RpoP